MTAHRHVAKRSTGWVELGRISGRTNVFAIVDPRESDLLWKRWQDYINGKLVEGRADSAPTFDEWRLHRNDELSHYDGSAVIFDTGPEGGHAVVEGRFGPYLGQAGAPDRDDYPVMQLVDIRIRLQDIDDCDGSDCDPADFRSRRTIRIRRRPR